MKLWTVIGLHDEDGATFAHQVEADDPYEAMRKVAAENLDRSDDACVVGAIEGAVALIPPGDDNNISAYAVDLAAPAGDDLCDLCYSSGVNVDHTTPCGQTVGVECGCSALMDDGTCGDDDCEECRKAKEETDGDES